MLFGNEQNPKGPGWRRLRKVEKELSGTHIHFFAPPLRLPIPDGAEPESQPKSFDLHAPDNYLPFGDPDPKQGIFHGLIWRSGWNFTGRPILDGETLGHLVSTISVLEVRDLPVNRSLFQQSELVELVRRLHDVTELGQYHDGHAEDRNPFDLTHYRWPNNLSPINSQWVERHSCEWLFFETQPLYDEPTEFYWLTPLSHQRCLMVHFYVNRWLYNAGNPYREQRSPITNYRALMENIMSTMVVELSESAEQEKVSIVNPAEAHYPLIHCTKSLVDEAKHTLYMWSGKGYTDKTQPRQGGDHRSSKEEVAAFIEQRTQPRPLPGCLAIGPAYIDDESVGERESLPVIEARPFQPGNR